MTIVEEEVQFSQPLNLLGALVNHLDSTGNFQPGNISSTLAYSLLNTGIKKLARQISTSDENYYLDRIFLHSVANQYSYDLPDNLDNVKQVWVDYSGRGGASADWKRVRPVDANNLSELTNLGQFSTSVPGYFMKNWRELVLLPTPTISSAGNSEAIQVWGVALPAKCDATTDVVNLPHDFVDYPAYYAARMISLREGKLDQAMNYQNILKEMETDLKDYISNRVENEKYKMQKDSEIWDESYNNYDEDYFIG